MVTSSCYSCIGTCYWKLLKIGVLTKETETHLAQAPVHTTGFLLETDVAGLTQYKCPVITSNVQFIPLWGPFTVNMHYLQSRPPEEGSLGTPQGVGTFE
jgi:hypothetical protein